MTSSYVNNLRLNEMGTGDESGNWGVVTNTNLTLIADALGFQSKTVASASTDTLTIPDGTETNNEAISLYVKLTGGNQACTITVGPNTVKKLWIIENATSQVITLTQGSGANVILAAGVTKMIYADGAGSGAALVDALLGLEVGANFYIKNAATGDNSTAQLYLQTAEADIAANDVLGKINFQAPNEGTGTDAILVAAAIQAKSEGDFSSSSNATSLEFMTGASEAAATKMTLSSGGNLDVTGDITGSTLNADGDTAAGDNAAIGYTAAEGLILTGQGSTSDITLKNDADATVFTVPTGTDDILFPDNAKAMFGAGSDLQIYHDASNSKIVELGTGNLLLQSSGNGINLQKSNGNAMIDAVTDGAVTLYHNNAAKLATESGGVNVTGYLDADNFKINGAQGSDGQVLTSTGSGVAFEDAGGGGAMTFIGAATVSNNTTNEFSITSCFSTNHDNYTILFHDFYKDTNGNNYVSDDNQMYIIDENGINQSSGTYSFATQINTTGAYSASSGTSRWCSFQVPTRHVDRTSFTKMDITLNRASGMDKVTAVGRYMNSWKQPFVFSGAVLAVNTATGNAYTGTPSGLRFKMQTSNSYFLNGATVRIYGYNKS